MITTINEWKKLNENNEINLFDEITELSAGELEELMEDLSTYFRNHSEELPNMDAFGIAKDLANVAKKIKNRTGN